MRKIAPALIMTAIFFLTFSLCGCDTTGHGPDGSGELTKDIEDLLGGRETKETVQFESFEAFMDNCPSDNVRTVMGAFPVNEFEQVKFLATYYLGDDNRDFPISVITFMDGGIQYYFSGAESHNAVFADFSQDDMRIYSGKNNEARVSLLATESGVESCRLECNGKYDEFALTVDAAVDFDTYFDVLSKITHDAYRFTGDDVVHIGDGIVYVKYISYDLAGPDYTLSEAGVLRETLCRFEPPGEEIVDYSSDPDVPGADLTNTPAYLYIELEIAGSGQTTLEILGAQRQVLYSVEIAADQEGDAHLVR
jgi:hypothetical protein